MFMQSDYEQYVAFLKSRGFDKLDSIKALKTTAGLSLAESKQIVHGSESWKERARSDEEFHSQLFEAIRSGGSIEAETENS